MSAPPPADDRLGGIVFRRATAGDARPTFDVVREAVVDLARVRGWGAVPGPSEATERFLAFRSSALRHDPDGFWVAEADGELVGFGIAVQREHVWYLAALHVRPAYQSRGVGAEIIRRSLEAVPSGSLLTVGTDARNPISNALYGRFGMFPETPMLGVEGATWAADTAPLRPGVPTIDELAAIDRAVLDVARPEDHEFWGAVSTIHGFSVMRDGRVVGYAYLQADGAIGPIAVMDPADLAGAVEAAVGHVATLGGATARVRIPGVARASIDRLLTRGWRYGDGMTMVLTSGPWGHWDRYVSSGADALL